MMESRRWNAAKTMLITGMTSKNPIRPTIAALEPSGIGKVTALGLGNPDVLPLWFGETDLVTPPFIRKAAAQALEDGRTFYTNARGILPLREAIRDFHKRTTGADIGIERITIPGAAMLAVVTALQMCCETGDNIVIVSPIWPNTFQAAKVVGAGRSEFLRVLSALVLSSLLVLGLILLLGGWGYWLMPVVFVAVFGRMLDTSYFRAFVLCLLAMAFQGVISYVTGGFSETP